MHCLTPGKSLIALIVSGIVCGLGGALYIYLPQLIHQSIIQAVIPKPHGPGGDGKPQIPMYSEYYLFNYTNHKEFLDGWADGVKPKVTQLGPYVYRVFTQILNQSFYPDNTMETWTLTTYQFEPTMSKGSEEDPIVFPNVPLRMAAQKARAEFQGLIDMDLVQTNAFIDSTAGDLLIHGFHSDVFETLMAFGKITYNKFKFLTNNTEAKSPLVGTGADDINKLGKVLAFGNNNENRTIETWAIKGNSAHNKRCATIEGADVGTFRPDATKDTTIVIFQKDMCRNMKFRYREEALHHGVPVYRYRIDASLFGDANVNEDNNCFCAKKEYWCRPTGIFPLQPCKGASLALSWPHFFMADRLIIDQVDGLSPQIEKHGSYFDIFPLLGIPLQGKVRVQTNLEVLRLPELPVLDYFPQMYMPLFWSCSGADLSEETTKMVVNRVSSALMIGNLVPLAVLILGGIIGFAGIVCSLAINYKITKVEPHPAQLIKKQAWAPNED